MAINDITRNYGPSVSQSHTTEAIGHAEDMSKVLYDISPDETFYLKRMGKESTDSLKFGWMATGITPPGVNAHLEEEDYKGERLGSLYGMENYCQRFVSSGRITEFQKKVAKVYKPEDEKARLMTELMKRHASDIEYAIVNNTVANQELNNTTPAMTGGIPYFLAVQSKEAALSTTDGVVTTTEKHGLETGDFVYFEADTMPTGLKAGVPYFVRLDTTDPTTKFTLYNERKSAVENITAKQVKPTTAGTALKMVTNNVISLHDKADFTLDDIDTIMEMAYKRGGSPKMAVMSPSKKRAFSKLLLASATINRGMNKERKLDVVGDVYQSDFGLVEAVAHRMMDDNRIDIMDMAYWKLRLFVNTHEIPGVQHKGSYEEFFIETVLGLQASQPKASAAIVDIKR